MGNLRHATRTVTRGFATLWRHSNIKVFILVALFIILIFLYLYVTVRWVLLGHTPGRRIGRRTDFFFHVEEQDPAPACRGLGPEALNSLPKAVYTANACDAEEVEECAVCLTVFEVGETVRGLPRCGHRFHIECIDMWFHSHATCPLCRSAVKPAKSARIDVAEPPTPPCFPCSSSSSSGGAVVEHRIDIPTTTEEEGASVAEHHRAPPTP